MRARRSDPAPVPPPRAGMMDRRQALMAMGGGLLMPCAARAEAWIDRPVVALNWGVAETLYAMGVRPVGAAEIPGYNALITQPATPRGVADVGLQGAPSMEALVALAPDLILIQAWQQHLRRSLERAARVDSVTIFTGKDDAYANAGAATRHIGGLLSCADRAEGLITACDRKIEDARTRLASYDGRPLYLAQILDGNIISLFSTGSLFQAVLLRLGLQNAWRGAPNLLWGGTRVGIERLADDPEARLVLIDPAGAPAARGLLAGDLFRLLPAVRAGRVVRIRGVWGFGALPSATRFAEALAAGLERGANG